MFSLLIICQFVDKLVNGLIIWWVAAFTPQTGVSSVVSSSVLLSSSFLITCSSPPPHIPTVVSSSQADLQLSHYLLYSSVTHTYSHLLESGSPSVVSLPSLLLRHTYLQSSPGVRLIFSCLITFSTPQLHIPIVIFFLVMFNFSPFSDSSTLQLNTHSFSRLPFSHIRLRSPHSLLHSSVALSFIRFILLSSSHTSNCIQASYQTSCLYSGSKNKCLVFSDLQMSEEMESVFVAKFCLLSNRAFL